MVVSEGSPRNGPTLPGCVASADVCPKVVMPSQRHGVLAKARRYREEPDRLLLVATEPLTVVVNGFHATHTVLSTRTGLICSCDRFRRGDECAHVLAVESRFCGLTSSLSLGDLATQTHADIRGETAAKATRRLSQNVHAASAARSDPEPSLRKGSS